MPDSTTHGNEPNGRKALAKYFADFDQFATIFCHKAASLVPEKALVPVVDSLELTLRAQIGELSKRVMHAYDNASKDQRNELDDQFQALAGPQLMSSSLSAAESISGVSGLASVGGLPVIIKKIIRALFGKLLGRFLDSLLEAIDETAAETGRTVDDSVAEGMYLVERRSLDLQVQLARLEQAGISRDAGRGDGDD